MKNKKMNNLNNKHTILIASGGTGGHVYPALSIIDKKTFNKYIIITDTRGEGYFNNFLKNEYIDTHIFIHRVSSPSSKSIVNKSVSLFRLFVSLIKSILIIITHKPDIVIGFGGYPSVAPILAAKLFNIPTIIHEQNAVVGRANQFLSKFSNILALSFINTKKITNVKKYIFTGNPVRNEFYEIAKINDVPPKDNKKLNILIYGGSLGASFFSKHLTLIFCSLPNKLKKRIKIIQQVRKEDIEKVQNDYLQNKIECEVSVFFNNIFEKFKQANLIITRAGGSTIAEIIASQKPAILVPFPNSLDNHQLENASFIKKNDGGWVFDEQKDKINKLKKLIINLIVTPDKLLEVSQQLNKLSSKLDNLTSLKTSSEFLNELLLNQVLLKREGADKVC
ncbi:MAG: UDP-N-acetylglucosamine--N-acetylmuramyl-(pentapeptide) pyrophosphoryl-undecaprenol N-acetylglucosamine transferase [Candidatus Puniceispirillales bacterium]